MKNLIFLMLVLVSLSLSAADHTITLKRGTTTISTYGSIASSAADNGVALTQAISEAQASDVLQLMGKQDGFDGVYAGNFTLAKSVVIEGVGGNAILKSVLTTATTANRVMQVTVDGVSLINLTITGGNLLNGNGAGINLTIGGITIKNCLFIDNQTQASASKRVLGGALHFPWAPTTRSIVENCRFINNAATIVEASTGSSAFGGAVGCNGSATAATFTNCVFANNYSQNYGAAYASTKGNAVVDNLQFINCTVVNNKTSDKANSAALNPASGAGITAINTVICGNDGGAGQLVSGSGSKYINCAYQGAVLLSAATMTDCFKLTTDESLFVKPTAEAGYNPTGSVAYDEADWSLCAISYLINRGQDNSTTVPTDISGNSRKQMGFVDIGAYESALKGNFIELSVSPSELGIIAGQKFPTFTATANPEYPTVELEFAGFPQNSNTVGQYTITGALKKADLQNWNVPANINSATLTIKEMDKNCAIILKRKTDMVNTFGSLTSTAVENGNALTQAMNEAEPADSLILKGKDVNFDGVYAGSFTVEKNLIIKGLGKVILKPASETASTVNRVMQINAEGSTLVNLTITGGNLLNAHGAGLYLTVGGTTIKNCIFSNNNTESNGGTAVWGGAIGISGGLSARTYVENCRFIDNAAWGNKANELQSGNDRGFGGAVASIGTASPMTFTNCLLANNYAKTYGAAFASGSGFDTEDNLQFINCTVVNNEILSGAAVPGLNPASGAGLTVINTVIHGNVGGQAQWWRGINSKYINSACEGSAMPNVGTGAVMENCIQLAAENVGSDADVNYPVFIDPVQGDWGLLTGSDLIKAGTVGTGTDLDGFDRSGNTDIGAYIYNGVGASVNGVATATGKLTRGAFAQMGDASTTKIDLTGATLPENPVACSTVNPNALIYAAADAVLSAEKNLVQNNTCEKLVLADGAPFAVNGFLTATAATYTRSCYRDGGWETIVIPFNVTDITSAGASVKADYSVEGFTEKKDNYAIFESATAMNAGTPYIMKYNQTANLATQECVFVGSGEVKAIEATKDFKGTYTEFPKGTVAGKYILNSTGTIFGVPGADATIPAFRAYLDGQSGPVQVKHMSGATGIDNAEVGAPFIYSNGDAIIVTTENALPVNIYTVDGRKVYSALVNGNAVIGGLEKGIYIVNQQKVVIK